MIFENLITLKNEKIYYNKWIQWNHLGIILPTEPAALREIIQDLLAFWGHCFKCTALSGCYFIERIMPEQPQHENCHCSKKLLSSPNLITNEISSYCPIEKFTKYIFANNKYSTGKNKIFESFGYNINDSYELKLIFEKTAKEAYLEGNYELGDLDKFWSKN